MKKFCSIISMVLLIVASTVIFVACGDDYKNMYLVLEYVEWKKNESGEGGEFSGEWKTVDVDKGIDFNLSENNKRGDYYSLQIRVTAKGTKKSVNNIAVSCSGSSSLQLNKNTVSSGEVVEIKVYSTGSAKLSFVPSVKSDKASVVTAINLYDELKSISQTDSYMPAVVKGGNLELDKLTDLIVYSSVNNLVTNQLGVNYSIDGVEAQDGVYKLDDGVELNTKNNANILTVKSGYAGGDIIIKASSIYKSDVTCDIAVKVVDNIDSGNFWVNYKSNYDDEGNVENNRQNKIDSMVLYPNLAGYFSSEVVLYGLFNNNSLYNFNGDAIKYDVRAFVDGKDVTDSVEAYHGIRVSKNGGNDNGTTLNYIISAESYLSTSVNEIKFVAGIKNLKFTGTKNYNLDSSILSYTINVVREDLPQYVNINEQTYRDSDTMSTYMYTDYGVQKGMRLNLSVPTTTQKTTSIKMKIYTSVVEGEKKYGSNYYPIVVNSFNGSNLGKSTSEIELKNISNVLYLLFDKSSGSEYPQNVYIEFKVLSSPAEFEGKEVKDKTYITVTSTLNIIGKIDAVNSSSEEGTVANNLFDGTSEIKKLQANTPLSVYLTLKNGNNEAVSYASATIGSQKGGVLFSTDGTNFSKELNCGELINRRVYIKATNNTEDQLIIMTDLGDQFVSRKLKFVATSDTEDFKLESEGLVRVGKKEYTEEDANEVYGVTTVYFYAMPFNSSVDFKILNSKDSSMGIYDLSLKTLATNKNISQYGADTCSITKLAVNAFNLHAQRTNLTCSIKVSVKFYTGTSYNIVELESNYYLEIASFTPVSDISFSLTNKELYYVNSLLDDNAGTSVEVKVNELASSKICFSDASIMAIVQSDKKSGVESLYYIEVDNETAKNINYKIEESGLCKDDYLDLKDACYSFKLTKDLSGLNSIAIKFVLKYYNGNVSKVEKSYNINVKLTNFIKAKDINIKGTDKNSNIYLSLQSEERKNASFEASVSNANATYQLLDYQLYTFDEKNATKHFMGDRILGDSVLSIKYDSKNKKFDLTAVQGGKYVLRIVSLDSFDDSKKDYTLDKYVTITISDGTESSPYYLFELSDIKNIANAKDKHYVIANDIDVNKLTSMIGGEFTGSINGLMTSFDANNGVTAYTQSVLKNLNISGGVTSLFEINKGALKNIVLTNVKFNLEITRGADNEDVNVGALVGENVGTIVNCLVAIDRSSNIDIKHTNETTSAKSYNIGVLIGKNTGNVYFYDEANSALKQYSNYRQMAEFNKKLTVNLMSVGSATTINIGGAIGDNAGMFVGNYSDLNQDETEYLTSYTDIDFVAISTITQTYTANIGGFAGLNDGTIKNVAVKGSVTGAGNNINMGGIAGNNTSETITSENGEKGGIINSATFSCEVIGRPYSKGETVQSEIINQNVGGAVGLNSGSLKTVYVLFVQNSKNSNKFGIVKGVDAVGGLVGKMTGGKILVGNVQGFVDDVCVVGNFVSNNATSNVHKSVAGLVGYAEGGTVSKSYAKVNISTDSGYIATLVNGTIGIDNSFFIGEVKGVSSLGDNLTINANETTYSLVKGYVLGSETYGKLFYNVVDEAKAYYYYDETLEKELWTVSEPTIVDGKINLDTTIEIADFVIPSWEANSNWTNEYKKYNSGLPVIVDNDEPTLLALAESLVAKVNDSYFKTKDNENDNESSVTLYKHDDGIFFANETSATAIVFLRQKTFQLVKNDEMSGLVDISVLPTLASKSYYVNVISGRDLISLVGNSITFKKAGRVEIEFISSFNPNAKDRVVIFAIEPINSFAIESNTSTMYSNSSTILSFVAKYNNEISNILDEYLYIEYSVEADVDSEAYTISSFGDSWENDGHKYCTMGNMQLSVLDFEGNEKEITFKATCYLDLSKFVYTLAGEGVEQKTIKDLFGQTILVGEEQTLTITLYQRATEIVSNVTDTRVATSQSVDIEVEVTTGYIDKNDTEQVVDKNQMDIDGQYLKTNLGSKENLNIKLSSDNSRVSWDMFNVGITYKLNSSKTGYVFHFNIELKDEYKNIDNDTTFIFRFYPNTNDAIYKDVEVVFEPQSITTLRVENFKSGVVTIGGENNIVEYISGEVQSAIIVPGRSGLIKIYVEPTFARVDEIEISSSSVTMDGKTYTIKFQQMLYDQNKGCYVSYMGYTTGSDSLKLVKNTYKDEAGNNHYTGVIYVRTVLENVVALKETFVVSVTATEYNRDAQGKITTQIKTQKTATRMLVTQFNPGLTLTSNGHWVSEDTYLIEKTSDYYTITATIVGYRVNQIPQIDIKDVDGNPIASISYTQGEPILQANGDYTITWSLKCEGLDRLAKVTISVIFVDDEMTNTSVEDSIMLYPIDYLLAGNVSLRGSANDVLRIGINSSKTIDIIWKSKSGSNLDSDAINQAIDNYIDYFYVNGENWENREYKSTTGVDLYKVSYSDKGLSVTGLGEGYVTVHFKIGYKYIKDENAYTIEFCQYNEGGFSLDYTFYLDFRVTTTEEDPDPIYNVEELKGMTDGGNYILMADLTLEDWSPLTAKIASLDGNNKRIILKSFDVSSGSEISVGLFESISEDCIIKNLTIDVSLFSGVVNIVDENANTEKTYFGFVAGKNEGLIYNTELINTSKDMVTVDVKTASTYSYIGGLVGQNNGNITNSRVGTPYFLSLKANPTTGKVTEDKLINTSYITIKGFGILGGITATNDGIISASYFQNANLENYNTEAVDTTNKTGGFVAVNTGSIFNSYTKGAGRNSKTPRGEETTISATAGGSASGFVFENSGVIQNCYSNIFVKSSSSAVAGFVYLNNGDISCCYSAGRVSSGLNSTTLATELPFVGVGIDKDNNNTLLSYGTLVNCFYLELKGDNFDYNFGYKEDADLPFALDDVNFADSENLLNFAFVEGNYTQSKNAVWTYYGSLDERDTTTISLGKTFLPELTSANTISRSVRYIAPTNNTDRPQLMYGTNYELGSQNNPYIIRDYVEYNNVFSIGRDNVIAGSIRLIDNIDFTIEDDTATVNTTLGYDLGDVKNVTATTFDGNGMTISGVDIKNYEETQLSSLGLFSNIYNAVVKSVNVEYVAMDYTSTQAVYSGGLAGIIRDSGIIDVKISGNNTTITAQNLAGGVAGLVTGESMLYNISSNVSVRVGKDSTGRQYISSDTFNNYKTTLGITEKDYDSYIKQLSYAGGIAGVIDVNASRITNVNKLHVGQNSSTSVTADIAGFVAGYLGQGVTAKRLNSVVNSGSYVEGAYISGGLVGENYAKIEFSQVAHIDSNQDKIDQAFADYILNEKAMPNTSPLEEGKYGNDSFVRGNMNVQGIQNIAGGFIGVNYGGEIYDSYSKASISANAVYVGGFVGVSVCGNYKSCYSQVYYNLEESDKDTCFYGGFIGYNKNLDADLSLTKIASKILGKKTANIDNVVSIMFFDRAQLDEAKELVDAKKYTFDYLVAESDNKNMSSDTITSPTATVFYLTYEGLSETSVYRNIIRSDKDDIFTAKENIEQLYDLEHEKQVEVFTGLFENFDNNIWDKDHEKFTPKLIENPVSNYYLITCEQDLSLIRRYPNGHFEVTNDIILSAEYFNYVLDLEFTGTLIGRIDINGGIPTISGIKIKLTNDTDSAGFFRKTTGAEISNLAFEYATMETNDETSEVEKTYVGLLSAEEKESEISSITVVASKEESSRETESNPTINLTGKVTIQQFGGLFGDSKSSMCTSCIVNLTDFEVQGGEQQNSAFGGLSGVSQGTSNTRVDGMFMDCSATTKGSAYGFKMVGGLVGHAQNILETKCSADTEIGNNDKAIPQEMGGINGRQMSCYVDSCKSQMKYVYDAIDNDSELVQMYYLGGVAGYIENNGAQKTADVLNTASRLELSCDIQSNFLYVGGVAGNVNLNTTIQSSVAWVHGCVNSAGQIYYGGLVGYVSNGATQLKIEGSYSYNEGSYDKKDGAKTTSTNDSSGVILTANVITAGGLIGKIEKGNLLLTIDDSSTNGAIWAKSCVESGGNATQSLIMGGLIGEWTKANSDDDNDKINLAKTVGDGDGQETTHIKNVYTTVALEYSQYKYGKGFKFDTNLFVCGIIGKIGEYENKLQVEKLVYSSDYTLSVEEKDLFDGEIVNVLTTALYDETGIKEYLGDGWTSGTGQLPYLTSLRTLLEKLSFKYGDDETPTLLKRFTTVQGTSLRPESIQDNKEFSTTYYRYYYMNINKQDSYVSENSVLSSDYTSVKFTGTLAGFILGNGVVIKANEEYSLKMGTSSVISNLTILVEAVEDTNDLHGAFANENNGTIFDCYADYYFKSGVTGGGIAGKNNGNILYCYVTVNIEGGSIDFSGIANENAGFIMSSGVAGVALDSEGAGIAYNNTGAIYNSYSALSGLKNSSSDTPISVVSSNNGIIQNCYYDIYANNEITNIENTEQGTKYAEAIETKKLQEKYGEYLTGKWIAYPMRSETETEDGEIIESINEFYNFGYPIYQISQKSINYFAETKEKEPFDYERKGLLTGNNTNAQPYLLINLGTLQLMNDFSSFEGKYFKLINNVEFKTQSGSYLFNSWQSIGNKDFGGVFATGERTKPINNTDKEEMRVIKNLSNAPLFDNIVSYAGVSNIEFKNSEGAKDVGALLSNSIVGSSINVRNIVFDGTFVGGSGLIAKTIQETNESVDIPTEPVESETPTEDEVTELARTRVGGSPLGTLGVIIHNITYKGSYEFSGKGLIANEINSSSSSLGDTDDDEEGGGTANIDEIITISSVSIEPSSVNGNVSGVLVSNITNRTVYFKDITVTGQYGIKSNGGTSSMTAGGLVGEIENANLYIIDTSLNIRLAGGIVGGIVGKSTNSYIKTDGDNEFSFELKGNTMGGFIGSINGGTASLGGCGVKLGLKVGNSDPSGSYAGGLVGDLKNANVSGGADVTIIGEYTNSGGLAGRMSGGTLGGDATFKSNGNDINNSSVFGGLVGVLSDEGVVSGSAIFSDDSEDKNYAKTFGGLIGRFESGTLSGTVECEAFVICGGQKVGGAVGELIDGKITSVELTLNKLEVRKGESLSRAYSSTNSGLGGLIGFVGTDVGSAGLGSVKISTLKIYTDGTASNVGGIFGFLGVNNLGYEKDDESEIELSDIEVTGVYNVGGFVGQYKADGNIVLTEAWAKYLGDSSTSSADASTGGQGFAKIMLPSAGDDDATFPSYEEVGNIGGLFGYYNSTSSMGFEVLGGASTQSESGEGNAKLHSFKNQNEVLTSDDVHELFRLRPTVSSAVTTKSYTVKNVGGIAGYTKSNDIFGVNLADIGKNEGMFSEIEATELKSKTSKVINLENVGGIVGAFDLKNSDDVITISEAKNSGNIVGCENVGGIIGKLSGTNENALFSGELINEGNISGKTNVGQAIGLAKVGFVLRPAIYTDDSGSFDLDLCGDVEGRNGVGGVIGMISLEDGQSIEMGDLPISGSVVGLINVGGLVGWVKESNVEISNTKTEEGEPDLDNGSVVYNFDVSGNTNVGGIIGFADTTDDHQVVLENFEKVESLSVKAKEYKYGTISQKDVYYMATSVGGVVGYAKNIKLDNVTIGFNYDSDGSLISQKYTDFHITRDGLNSGSNIGQATIDSVMKQGSTVKNYILKVTKENENELDYPDYSLNNVGYVADYRNFDDMTTGIGGMVGTLEGFDKKGVEFSGVHINVSVMIENGMNIGGLVGYLEYEEGVFSYLTLDKNHVQFGSGSEASPTYIYGAVGVGGVFGKIQHNENGYITAIDKLGNMDSIEVTLTYLAIQANPIGNSDKSESTEGTAPTHTIVHGEYVGGFVGITDSIYSIKLTADKATIYLDDGGYYGGLIGKLNGSLGKYDEKTGAGSGESETDINFSSATSFTGVAPAESETPGQFKYGGLVGLADASTADVVVVGSDRTDAYFVVDTVLVSTDNPDTKLDISEENKQIVFYKQLNIQHNIIIAKKTGNQYYENPYNEGAGWHPEYTMFRTLELGGDSGQRTSIYDSKNILDVVYDKDDGKITYTIYDYGTMSIMYTRWGIAYSFANTIEGKVTANGIEYLRQLMLERYGLTDDITGTGNDVKFCATLIVDVIRGKSTCGYLISERVFNDALYYNNYTKSQEGITDTKFAKYPSTVYFVFEQNNVTGMYYKYGLIYGSLTGEYDYDNVLNNKITWDESVDNTDNRTFSLFDIMGKVDLNLDDNEKQMIDTNSIAKRKKKAFAKSVYLSTAGKDSHGWGLFGWNWKNYYSETAFAITSAQYSSTDYLWTDYNGLVGFMSRVYNQDWYFAQGALEIQPDEFKNVGIDTYNGVLAPQGSGDDEQYKLATYFYYSSSKPADYGAIIDTSEDLYDNDSIYNTGLYPKYIYEDGSYYMLADGFAKKTIYRSREAKFGWPSGSGWWCKDSNDLYYVASEIADMSETQIENTFGVSGLDTSLIRKEKTITKYLQFNDIVNYKPDGLEGYDCIKIDHPSSVRGCWEVSDTKPTNARYFTLYQHDEFWYLGDPGSEEYPAARKYVYEVSDGRTLDEALYEELGIVSNSIYSIDDLKYVLFSGFGDENDYDIKQTYYYYDLGHLDDYVIDEANKRVAKRIENASSVIVYDAFGNLKTLDKITNTDIGNYYIGLDATDTNAKASNFYYGYNGEWYEYDRNYGVKNIGEVGNPIYIMTETKMSVSQLDAVSSRNTLTINGAKIYTRFDFKYNDGLKTTLEEKGLLPSRSTSGWGGENGTNYTMSEVVMFTGRTYYDSGENKGKWESGIYGY